MYPFLDARVWLIQPFAPARAFHTDVLIGELFHAEVSVASAGAGGLMDATHTRVWALLRWGHDEACAQCHQPLPGCVPIAQWCLQHCALTGAGRHHLGPSAGKLLLAQLKHWMAGHLALYI